MTWKWSCERPGRAGVASVNRPGRAGRDLAGPAGGKSAGLAWQSPRSDLKDLAASLGPVAGIDQQTALSWLADTRPVASLPWMLARAVHRADGDSSAVERHAIAANLAHGLAVAFVQ